ncbi:enoyl-hydratase [Ilyonectria destructans]|nr:enoyl-hydratase [Ilyonectria destructans]
MSSSPNSFTRPPPPVVDTLVSFPAPHVLLVTLNRPDSLNAIPKAQHFALEALWAWFDNEESLRVAIITGTGRAFCAGADLKEWNKRNLAKAEGSRNNQTQAGPEERDRAIERFPSGGFGGMSNRAGLKPIIAAVNGVCFGGGMEMAINCDMVIASDKARFSLPEVTIGVIALAGALPRLSRSVGRQRASEMALGGDKYDAETMKNWGLVNEIVKSSPDDGAKTGVARAVVDRALEWAKKIAGNSPDAVIVSREGLKLGWEAMNPEVGTTMLVRSWYDRLEQGANMVEGIKSFVERRSPVWSNSKL